MIYKIISAAILITIFFTQAVQAETQDIQNEILIAAGTLRAEVNYPSAVTIGPVEAGIGYGRIFNDWLELTSMTLFRSYSGTISAPGGTVLNFTLGPTFNFPINEMGVASAFFITLGAGFHYAYLDSFTVAGTAVSLASQSTFSFSYDALIGKRFSVLPNVSWTPMFSISGFTGTDIMSSGLIAGPIYRLIPLQISLLF